MGKPLTHLVPDAERGVFHRELIRLREQSNNGGEPRGREWDLRLEPREGATFDGRITAAAVYDATGKPTALRWRLRGAVPDQRARKPPCREATAGPSAASSAGGAAWLWPLIPHLLVVEIDRPLRRALERALTGEGYRTLTVETAEEALERVDAVPPDLILLELDLPGTSGLELCCTLRPRYRAPILALSERGAERDKVAALDAGADGYLTKPFGLGELHARIRAQLRRWRAEPDPDRTITAGALQIDPERRNVTVQGRPVKLTRKQFELLCYLGVNAGRLLTHQMILQNVWGSTYGADVAALRVHINHLRRKIEPDPAHPAIILTEVGTGYRFVSQDGPGPG